ncbi:MAG: response regulator [Burkholderiales bacterium]|nr:response regulator [Burkholderiales bacterium]
MKKTVLLVEDNPDEIVLARRAFDKAGLDISLDVAQSGDEACAMLAHDDVARLPQLVLLDLQMVGKNGLAVLRELRARPLTKIVPVVLLSSSDEPEDIATAYSCGANSYLRKPVNFDAFVALVRDVHQYWLVHNRLPPAPPGEPE